MSTPDSTLISALRILARDVESEDGVANAMLFEAADRFGKLVLEAHNLRAEIERLSAERRWIPVEERLPKPMDYVLVHAGDLACMAWRDIAPPHEWLGCYDAVTYWMPLPHLPDQFGEVTQKENK